MSSLATLIVMAAASLGAEAAKEKNPMEGAAYFVGTWAIEGAIAEEDIPELGLKKGQKIPIEIRVDWAIQDAVLEWDLRPGIPGTQTVWAKGIQGIHPEKKQEITGYWFGADGSVGQTTSYKEGDTLFEKHSWVDADGKKHTRKVKIEIKDNNTHIRYVTVDGKSESPKTWRRKQVAEE